MTSPLREMTAAARAMARGDYSRRVRATSRDEVGELAERVQPDGRRPGGGRPAPPRAGRQRLARAADADLRAAGRAGEHRRRRVPSRPGERCARRWTRPNGSAGWSRSCSTCPGSTPAWCRWTLTEFEVRPFLATAVGRPRWPRRAARRRRPVRRRRDPARPPRRRPTRSGWHQVVANLLDNARRHSPPARTRHASPRAPASRPDACGWRSRTRAPASRRASGTASSSGSPAAAARRRPTAAPGWASRSRAGPSICTAAASPSPTVRPAAASRWHYPVPYRPESGGRP